MNVISQVVKCGAVIELAQSEVDILGLLFWNMSFNDFYGQVCNAGGRMSIKPPMNREEAKEFFFNISNDLKDASEHKPMVDKI